MPMPTNDDIKRVNKDQDNAIAKLVDAVIGGGAPCAPYGEQVYKATCNLVKLHEQNDTIAELVNAAVGWKVPRAPYGDHVHEAACKLVDITCDESKHASKGQDDAIAELANAVVGREMPRASYGDHVYKIAFNLVEAINPEGKLVNKNQDDAIAELIDAVIGREAPRAPYGEHVYKAVGNLVEACKDLAAVYNYRLTDVDEYKAEVERRRQIGLTIDPATAETMFWWADHNDPYCILHPEYHEGQVGREHFARHPGASGSDWVYFGDLPTATRDALRERDGRKLWFPYGLHPVGGDDLINYPPGHEEKLLSD